MSRLWQTRHFKKLIVSRAVSNIVAGPLIAGAGPTIAFGTFAVIAAAAIIGALMFGSVRSLTNSVDMQSKVIH